MKKVSLIALCVVIIASCALMCACTSDDPIVGTYKLVSVTMDNGTTRKNYNIYEDGLITENSVVLNIKNNYKWTLFIKLPGADESEDGIWVKEDGVYALKEDRYDDEQIDLTVMDDIVSFIISEDGYLMNITLKKVA